MGSDETCDLVITDHSLAAVHVEFTLHPRFSVRVFGPQAVIIHGPKAQKVQLHTGRIRELHPEDQLYIGTLKISWLRTPSTSKQTYVLDWKDIELHSADIPDTENTFLVRMKGDYPMLNRLHAQLGANDLIANISEQEHAVLFADRSRADIQRLMQTIVQPTAFGVAPWRSQAPQASLIAATTRHRVYRSPSVTVASRDPAMQETMSILEQAAGSAEPALIVGETGTGKDCLIHNLHSRSGRTKRPLIHLSAIDISDRGISETTIASVSGGTLVIDEVSALSPTAQFSLARDLERGYLSDLRLVATSSEPLEQIVEYQYINRRLFFRLARFFIHIPPLRQRHTDIIDLANTFLAQHKVPPLTQQIEYLFLRYRWPGNVRELENIIARAALSSGKAPLEIAHLPIELRNHTISSSLPRPVSPSSSPRKEPLSLRDEIAALERRRIIEALDTYPTQTEAAKALGIPLRTFVNRLDSLGIPRARKNRS